ncbi:MAG: TetR family transcriptional regulator [Planctomycetota bacterium]
MVVRTDPARVCDWSAREVAERWGIVFPKVDPETGETGPWDETEVDRRASDPVWVETRRERLASVSWFMRIFKQRIARRANREDGVTGHFWEGRFQSAPLLDDAAVVSCMAYVDLRGDHPSAARHASEATLVRMADALIQAYAFFREDVMGRRPFVRERILDAAFDLVARRGYEAVSTREIAEQALVGHASMYRHFASKEALGRELYRIALPPITAAFRTTLAMPGSAQDVLGAVLRLLCRLYDERPRALALLVFPPHDFEPDMLIEGAADNPRSLLARRLACDADALAVVWGALTGPLQDRYLRRRRGAMADQADALLPLVRALAHALPDEPR